MAGSPVQMILSIMRPIEKLYLRLQEIESKVKRMEDDVRVIKESNAKLHLEKKNLEDIIIVMKAENSKEEEEEVSKGWFGW